MLLKIYRILSIHQYADDHYFPSMDITNNIYEFLCGHIFLLILSISLRVYISVKGTVKVGFANLMSYEFT